MLQSFDFLFEVWETKKLQKQLLDIMKNSKEQKIIIGAYLLVFDFNTETVTIDCHDENYYWKHKIVPTEITFQTLEKLINKNFDNLEIHYL